MFSDPLVLNRQWSAYTADTSQDLSLPCSERAADHSTYRTLDADGNDHIIFFGHQYGRRWRFTARYTIIGATPLWSNPTEMTKFTQSCYVVFDAPDTGPIQSTATQTGLQVKMYKGIGGLLTSLAGSNVPFDRIVRSGET